MHIQEILAQVSPERMRRDLFHLCRDPLPFRKVNYTRPGLARHSLEEADAHIRGILQDSGYAVETTVHRVQPYRCDSTKPLHHWYSRPHPDDPFHDAANIEAVRPSAAFPDEILQVVSHKDSMSWIDSPGAHDNAVGTAASLEIARILAHAPLRRTVRFLFCNEEHFPWTSRFAAEAAAARGDRILAVFNLDSLDGKSDADHAAGRKMHSIGYSTDEGRSLAGLLKDCEARYRLGLEVSVFHKARVNDDDGMFIQAGFRTTVVNLGSWPYADEQYHLPGDVPERVDIDNLARSAQLVLAGLLELDVQGAAALTGAGDLVR